MKKLLFISAIAALVSCEPRQGKTVDESPTASANSGIHEVLITEVVPASSYTYLKGTEEGKEVWMAVSNSDIENGKKYYYSQPLEMTNFRSKELDRTFESILFINKLVADPAELSAKAPATMGDHPKGMQTPGRQESLTIEPEEGVTTIQQLYANKAAFKDKTVKVKGLVMKFNAGIMERNWVHIQDGTAEGEKFDLTITTEAMVKTGQVVVFEGKVALDQDFGYGYKYDLLVEQATLQTSGPEVRVN